MFDPWVGKIPWRRKWQSTPVFLPGKSHGQRSLVGYSPWSRIESDMTEQLLHFHRADGLPWWLSGKECPCQCRRCRRQGFDPWVGKIWKRKWQPIPEFLPGKSHGQRNLVGYSPWGHKESDRTERLHFHFHSLRASVLGSFSGHRIR